MKEIRLVSLNIHNMYGYASAEMNFADGKNVIRNKMRYGKTTLLNCVLFAFGFVKGKYQPCIEEYPVKNLDSRVDMLLSVDGLNYSLRVESKQKWGAKDKESDEKVLVGNTLTYNFDGIECQLKDYKVKLADLFGVPYERIEMLVDIRYFNTDTTKWKWNDRRELVYSLLNVDEKTKDVAYGLEYHPIAEDLLKGKSEAEIQKALNTEKKRIADEQFKVNVLMGEKTKEYTAIADKGLDALAKRKEEICKEIDAIESRAKSSDNRRRELSEEITALKFSIKETKMLNDYGKMEYDKKKSELESKIASATTIYRSYAKTLKDKQDILAETKESLKQAQNSVFAESTTICPTCGRKLEESEILKARERFKADKEKTIADFTAMIARMEPEIAEFQKSVDEVVRDGKALRVELNELLQKGYCPKDTSELETKLAQSEKELGALTESVSVDISSLRRESDEIDRELAMAEKRKADIAELKKSLIELAKADSVRVQKQNALKAYIIAKAEKASEIVNSSFNGIKFRLFKINGGLAENPIEPTFEVIHEISGYASQSHGQKIYSDICIGIALRKLYGLNLFMFVDEIQSVTEPYDYQFQTIELYTTAEDVTDIKATKIKDLYTIEDTVK